MKPDRVVVGTDNPRTAELLRALYEPFTRNHDRFIVMDVRSAELTKYAANAMLATKISFMNELANLAERVGADIEKVRVGIGSDPRIGYTSSIPGCGYGGSCFPKDVQALARIGARRRATSAELLDAVEAVNKRQKERAVRQDHAALRRQARGQDDRAVGPRVQAEHRRHARGAEPRAHGSAVGRGREGARLRSGRRRRKRSASTASAPTSTLCRSAHGGAATAPMRSRSSPSGRSSAARTSTRIKAQLQHPVIFDGRNLYDPGDRGALRPHVLRDRPRQVADARSGC